MIEVENLSKRYPADGGDVHVLRSVSLKVEQGEFVSIAGRSGSGKTTLLNVMSTLLEADSGCVKYLGNDLSEMGESALMALRKQDFAVVFQFHYLLPYLTVMENVLLPFMDGLKPVSGAEMDKARQCLDRVGLAGKEKRLPGGLSGGEQQRVAIARALVKSSRVLFADEPTGSLDKSTGNEVMDLISELAGEGMTTIMVTHDDEYAARADRQLSMSDGRISGM